MEFMSANFGPPPLKTLTVSPIPGTFGQGFPGLIYLSTLAYLKPSEYPAALHTEQQRRFFSELSMPMKLRISGGGTWSPQPPTRTSG